VPLSAYSRRPPTVCARAAPGIRCAGDPHSRTLLRPALLLVDIVVYDRAGWELLARLRAAARTRGIPLVVRSTDPRPLARAQADPDRYGGDAFIEKPFDIATVLNAVRALVGPA